MLYLEGRTPVAVPTIFNLCIPRADVLAGTSSDSDFAADLARVVRGLGDSSEYSDPIRFFANTIRPAVSKTSWPMSVPVLRARETPWPPFSGSIPASGAERP